MLQISIIIALIGLCFYFGYYQFYKAVEDMENESPGGNGKDYRIFKRFLEKRRD